MKSIMGRIIILKERNVSFKEISITLGIPLKRVKEYYKDYLKLMGK